MGKKNHLKQDHFEWESVLFFFLFFSNSFHNERVHQKGFCENIRDAPGEGSPFTFRSPRERPCEEQVSEIVPCKRIT